MQLIEIVTRPAVPEPWAEGEKIPWNDPAFSARMLREHLSQEHDAASRRSAKIDAHVAWIHGHLLSGQPTRILDLGCGPGLYASRLARLGHRCVGIDFGPASIAYAVNASRAEGLNCTYVQADIRAAEYGSGFGLAMLIFGEFNVFHPADARRILHKAHDALEPGGRLLLEPSTFDAVRAEAQSGRSWYASPGGLWTDRPHLCLMEQFWDAERQAQTTRYDIVDAQSGTVTPYASSVQAYTGDEYRALLAECGYVDVAFYPSLTGEVDESQSGLLAISAHRPQV